VGTWVIDGQEAATTVMNPQSAEYYRGGALDGISKDDNKNSFKRCRIVPRVMRDVSTVAPQTTIFGLPSALPLYISPASNAILGHPDGELNLTRAVSLEHSSTQADLRPQRPVSCRAFHMSLLTHSQPFSRRKQKRTRPVGAPLAWCIRSTSARIAVKPRNSYVRLSRAAAG